MLFQQLGQHAWPRPASGVAAQHLPPRPVDPLVVVGRRFGEHFGRQRPRRFDERRIVQQHQRRRRRVRNRPLGRALLARRRVERHQPRVQELPLPMHVDGPAELIVARRGRVVALRKIERRVVSSG